LSVLAKRDADDTVSDEDAKGRAPAMTSTTTTTTTDITTPDDPTQLVIRHREFDEAPFPDRCPPGGWADPRTVDLRAVEAGLRWLIS
jgi:hypothetical protein